MTEVCSGNSDTSVSPSQPITEGYREAEGHAASLLQQALWIEESVDGTVAPSQRVDLSDVDTDEMRSCAQYIMQQSARIQELEARLAMYEACRAKVDCLSRSDFPKAKP